MRRTGDVPAEPRRTAARTPRPRVHETKSGELSAVSQSEIERRQDEAEAHIRAAMMNELGDVMHRTNLPPMAVLRLAARSIGRIYREMADAHSGIDPCPCGWRPHEASEIEVLVTALRAACGRRRTHDLRLMQIAGTA